MKISVLRSRIKICRYHLNRVINVALKAASDDIDVKLHVKISCKLIKTMMMMLMKA